MDEQAPPSKLRLMNALDINADEIRRVLENLDYVPKLIDVDVLRDLTVELIRQGCLKASVVDEAAGIYRRLDTFMHSYYQNLKAASAQKE